MALTYQPMTTAASPAPGHAELTTQIADQLCSITALLDMLKEGTLSAAAGDQLDTSLRSVALAAGQLGWGELRDDLARLPRELADCVRSHGAPEPGMAAVWHRALTWSFAPRHLLAREAGATTLALTRPRR